MKKLIGLLMALTMVAMMAACTTGNTATDGTEPVSASSVNSSLEVLETIWNVYGEDVEFTVIGGNMESPVDGAPGNYDLAYAENLVYSMYIPVDLLPAVDEAASIVHAMHDHIFSSYVLHLVDGTDVTEFADAVYTAIIANQPWMFGFLEHIVIAVIDGSYVLVTFGVTDTVVPFQTHLNEVYPEANIIYTEALED